METLRCVATLRGHTNWVRAVAVTPDGKRAISAGDDHVLHCWSLESADRISSSGTVNLNNNVTLKGHTGWVIAVAVTPDGRHAISGGSDGELRKWCLEEHICVAAVANGHLWRGALLCAVAISPDGSLVLSGGGNRFLRVQRVDDLSLVATLQHEQQGEVSAVAITPDGRYALCGSRSRFAFSDSDGRLHIW